jgi:hypothetical protein
MRPRLTDEGTNNNATCRENTAADQQPYDIDQDFSHYPPQIELPWNPP